MVAICYPFHQEHLTPASVSSHQVDIQSFHSIRYPPAVAAVSQPKVQDSKASKPEMAATPHTSPELSISTASRIAEFISNSQKNGRKVHMEDYFTQLSNAGYSLKTRENLKQEILLKMRADKAARESAELLTIETDQGNSFLGKGAVAKKPVKELSAKAELMEVPKTLVWETKTEVPLKEELENKNENSVFVKRKIKFEEKTEESVSDDTASSNDDHGGAKVICDTVPTQELVQDNPSTKFEDTAFAKYVLLDRTKAARKPAELLTIEADLGDSFLDKKPAMDVSGKEKTELMEVPKF